MLYLINYIIGLLMIVANMAPNDSKSYHCFIFQSAYFIFYTFINIIILNYFYINNLKFIQILILVE